MKFCPTHAKRELLAALFASITLSACGGGGDSAAAPPAGAPAPAPAPAPSPGPGANKVSSGGGSTCAVTAAGTVQCWGQNAYGNLGYGALGDTTTSSKVPVTVAGISGATAVSVGGLKDACALLATGEVKCWGNGDSFQLGVNGLGASVNTPPVFIPGINTAVSVTMGESAACAALANGTVKCWGSNVYGELGDNGASGVSSATPVTVSGITNAVAVSAGSFDGCALLATGAVQCWGLNTIKGHLGNGTTVNSAIPVTVTGTTNAIALSVGFGNACAALSTGAVQCWGAVGVSPERVALIPETVAGVSGAVTIATNGSTACAVTASGSIQCWGNNVYGQFGNGTSLTLSEAPVAVSGITNAVSVTAGFLNICARLSTGSVQCWGYNNTGQLGNGTLTQSNVPVTVTGY